MEQPVSYRPRKAAFGKRIKGTTDPIPHGTEVVIASVQLLKGVFPVLETLYYDGDGAGTGYLKFRVTVDGYELHNDWANSYNPIGEAGKPAPVAENLPAGRLLEVRVSNETSGATEDDTLRAYCDGEIEYYENPID